MGILLDATEQVLRTHGYSGASTNRIARAAGVSVGSLYQYFGDKDGLIGAALERALAREGEILARLADHAREHALEEGFALVVGAVVRSRIGQRALLAVLAEHGLRFGPGTTVQVVLRHQRAHPDPIQRLVAGRRPELRDDEMDALCFPASVLLQSASFGYAVAPAKIRSDGLVGLLSAALAEHLTDSPATPEAPPPRVAALDVARVEPLLSDACRSAAARAALLDELVYEELQVLEGLCDAGAAPAQVCAGLLRFWSESARRLARAAGASSLTGPGLEPEAWTLRAERRSRRVRAWLCDLHGRAGDEDIETAVFVLGHAFLELGLLLAQSREASELAEARLAGAAVLLGRVATLAGRAPLAAVAHRE